MGLRIRSREVLEEEESETVQHVTDVTNLSPGDPIIYSITHEVNYNSGEKMWVKIGSSTTIRVNETPQAARSRLVGYVHDAVQNTIQEAIAHAQSM